MRAYLVRVGIDQAFGKWNAPIDPGTGDFVYIPIPEKAGTAFQPRKLGPSEPKRRKWSKVTTGPRWSAPALLRGPMPIQ